MNTALRTASNDSVRKINRAIVKKVVVHITVAVASTAAVVVISNVIEKRHENSESTTED
jgi:hypothetical protein